MKLFAVYLSLVVTCKRLHGMPGDSCKVADSRKLAVLAEDEAEARIRAADWLEERSRTAALRRAEFHQGHYSDIIAVHLLTGSEIRVVEAEQGVVRL